MNKEDAFTGLNEGKTSSDDQCNLSKLPDLYNAILNLGLNPIKVALSSVSELYSMPDSDLLDFKTFLISSAFLHHYNNNVFYKNLCDSRACVPSTITCSSDLVALPLIPISMFKSSDSHKLLSVSLNAIELEMRSTGTSGIPSIARRCSCTVDYGVLGIAFNQLNAWENKFDRHIIGPPFIIHRFISFLKASGQKLTLDKSSYIITLGGWKRFSGQMISRVEFNNECIEYLGVKQAQIRDMYALVESNGVAIDDEYGVKCVSPFIHFSVRNPKKIDEELPIGEIGQLAILDPLSLSTPGFILTEDLVKLLPKPSDASRGGQRLQYIMRLPESTEFGCCAVNLDKCLDKAATNDIESSST